MASPRARVRLKLEQASCAPPLKPPSTTACSHTSTARPTACNSQQPVKGHHPGATLHWRLMPPRPGACDTVRAMRLWRLLQQHSPGWATAAERRACAGSAGGRAALRPAVPPGSSADGTGGFDTARDTWQAGSAAISKAFMSPRDVVQNLCGEALLQRANWYPVPAGAYDQVPAMWQLTFRTAVSA
jgi:hypothetical protein